MGELQILIRVKILAVKNPIFALSKDHSGYIYKTSASHVVNRSISKAKWKSISLTYSKSSLLSIFDLTSTILVPLFGLCDI